MTDNTTPYPALPDSTNADTTWSARIVQIDYEANTFTARYEGLHPEIGAEVAEPGAARAGDAEPVAWLTRDDEGSPAMLFFDPLEAGNYCDINEEPEPLYAAPQAPERGQDGDLYRMANRAIEAWDCTVLPKAHDGMMQERMEDLRAALAASREGGGAG